MSNDSPETCYFEPQRNLRVTSDHVKDAKSELRLSSEPSAERGARVLIFPDSALAEIDDVSLVGMLIDGDARAPRIVWQRFAPMVLRMLKRAFGPEYEVDDLAQEVFLVLFRRAHTLREPQAVRAFVIAITAHTIRYELRRKAALRWLRFGEPSIAKAADVDLDAREALSRLYLILNRLSSNDRTAFVLRFMEGLEVAAVSQALGVSLATTKRRLTHAWKRVVLYAQRDASLVEYLVGLGPGGLP
jgi:RNA polymerase sigma-70 factor (ECF subfamily)